ncbi:MAG: glycosyltransferase [Candidatus Diapherotrites archaeon]
MKLSIIIPIFNEEKTLEKLVNSVKSVKLPVSREIILVNDGSRDGTAKIMRKLAKGDKSVKIVDYGENRGKGFAVRKGMEEAKGDLILIQDADLEYNPKEIPKLLKPVLGGDAEVVYGSRFTGKIIGKQMISHTIGNKILSGITAITYGKEITDMETGYKLFTRKVVYAIKGELKADHFDIEPEITAKIINKGFEITEVPITYTARQFDEGKKITWMDGVPALKVLLLEKMKQSHIKILLLIILFALILRVVGLGWGLPHVFHPDESIIVRIAALFGTGDFNPHWFTYPSFQMYATFFLFGIYYIAGVVLGLFSFPPTRALMEQIYFSDPTNFYLIARGLVAFYGVLTIPLIYKIGKNIFNRRVGLIAALLLAITPLHVIHSHFAALDVAISFWILLSLYFALKIFDSDNLRWYLLSGIAAGLAFGTKYLASPVILGLIGVHLVKNYLKKKDVIDVGKSLVDKKLWIGIISVFVIFLAVNPFVVLSPGEFFSGVERVFATQYAKISPIGMDIGNSYFFYITYLLNYALGLPLLLITMTGFLYALYTRKKEVFALLFLLAGYFIFINTFDVHFMRYLLPMIPLLLVFAAALIVRMFESGLKDKRKRFVVILVISIVFFYTIAYSLAFVTVMIEKDVRTEANEWFEARVPEGVKVGIVISPVGMIETDDAPIDGDMYEVIRSKDPGELIAQEVDYLLISNYDYRQYYRLQERFPNEHKFYEDLLNDKTNYKKIAEFENRAEFFGIDFEQGFLPHSMNTVNPKITIFERVSELPSSS